MKGGYIVDEKKLADAMKKKRITCQEMCAKLSMSRSAFYRKCRGITEFTQSEIQKIVDILELESPVGIFFSQKVS